MAEFAVIWDMDGVLVDSTKNIWESFSKLLKPHGIQFSDEDIKKYLGLSLRDQIASWKERWGVELELEKFSKQAGEAELEVMEKKANKNLSKLLNELRKNKVPMGIGTSSLRWRAEKIIELLGIKDYFSVLISAEDITKHKPNPDIFLKVAEKLSIKPENCVVIEDAASGIEAAKRGNMKAIGYLTKYHKKSELRMADLIIEDFSEISYNKIKEMFKNE